MSNPEINLNKQTSSANVHLKSLHGQDNNVACTREEVEEIFVHADKDKSGQLNIRQEFKYFNICKNDKWHHLLAIVSSGRAEKPCLWSKRRSPVTCLQGCSRQLRKGPTTYELKCYLMTLIKMWVTDLNFLLGTLQDQIGPSPKIEST